MADDASPNEDVWATLQQLTREDARIKVVRRLENGHISRASNDALALASGDFVVLMDNDDVLAPHALEAVAAALQAHPDADSLFGRGQAGQHGAAFWPVPEAGLEPVAVHGAQPDQPSGGVPDCAGEGNRGFRIGLEGSQDYDLALRCLERIEDDQVIHIPQVLYHWRAIEGSTALATTEKPYAGWLRRACRSTAALRAARAGGNHGGLELPLPAIGTGNRENTGGAGGWGRKGEEAPAWTRQKSMRVDVVRCCAADAGAVLEALGTLQADAVLLVSHDLAPTDPGALNDLVGLAMEPGFAAAAGTVCGPQGELLGGAWVLNTVHGASVLMHGLPAGNPGYMGRASLDQEVCAAGLSCMVVRPDTLRSMADGPDLPWGWCVGLAWGQHWRRAGLKVAWSPGSRWCTVQPQRYPRQPEIPEMVPLKHAVG